MLFDTIIILCSYYCISFLIHARNYSCQNAILCGLETIKYIPRALMNNVVVGRAREARKKFIGNQISFKITFIGCDRYQIFISLYESTEKQGIQFYLFFNSQISLAAKERKVTFHKIRKKNVLLLMKSFVNIEVSDFVYLIFWFSSFSH